MSRTIYKKYADGGNITNAQLEQAIKDYATAESALLQLGPHFEIARKEAGRVLVWLKDVRYARKNK